MGKKPSELYDSIYQNSLKSEGVKPVAVPPRRKINLKPAITIVAAAALIVGTVGVYNRVEYIRDQRGVNDFYKDSGYYAAIQDTIWDSIDDSGHKYGYNQDSLAGWVSRSENPDLALFSIYKAVRQRTDWDTTIWNMNEVTSRVHLGQDGSIGYESFQDYLTKKGFVDKDGKPDTDKYEKIMTERVLAEKTVNEVEQNNGVSK